MKITYLNTGGSVGNETDWSSPITIPIGKGLKQEILFQGMNNVTSMTIGVYRSGALVYQQNPVPSATMRIDLSVFSQVLPSLIELYKYSQSNAPSGIQECIKFTIQDGGTTRVYNIYVCSVPSPNLITYGYTSGVGINRCSPDASVCAQNRFTAFTGITKSGYTSPIIGIGTRAFASSYGASSWIGTLDSGLALQSNASVYTQSVYIDNRGVEVRARFSQVQDSGTTDFVFKNIKTGFRGYVYHTYPLSVAARYNIEFYTAGTGGNVDFNIHAQMLNQGPYMPWVRAGATINAPCVGAMTDYRSGKCNVLDTANTLGVRDTQISGFRKYAKYYFPVGSQNVKKFAHFSSGVAEVWSGTLGEGHFVRNLRLANPDGSVYGWLEFERKMASPPLPTCSVLARWLNTKGWYDTMLFEKYSVKPLVENLQNSEYEVTVQAESNWDNEPCLEWLQRSPDIVIRIPNDITQVGEATLTSTNVFTNVGGDKKKVFQYKFNVKLQKA